MGPLKSDNEAREQAGVPSLRDSRLPVCVFADGTRLEGPTIRQITEKLGWFRNPSRSEKSRARAAAGLRNDSAEKGKTHRSVRPKLRTYDSAKRLQLVCTRHRPALLDLSNLSEG
jgi:hypothetical protein